MNSSVQVEFVNLGFSVEAGVNASHAILGTDNIQQIIDGDQKQDKVLGDTRVHPIVSEIEPVQNDLYLLGEISLNETNIQ